MNLLRPDFGGRFSTVACFYCITRVVHEIAGDIRRRWSGKAFVF